MTRAAQQLRISVPSVSAQIRSLELDCGAPLFSRKSRTLELTYEGQVLYDSLRKHFEGIEKTFEQLSQSKDFSMTLELGLQPGWHEFLVQQALVKFSVAQSGFVRFSLRAPALPRSGALRGESAFPWDGLIGPADEIQRPRQFSKTTLYTEDYYFCGAKKFLREYRRKTKAMALEIPLIYWSEDRNFLMRAVEEVWGEDSAKVQLLRSDYPEYVIQLLQNQPSLSLLPQSVLKGQNSLEALPWGQPLRREIVLLSKSDSLHHDLLVSFRKMFADQRGKAPVLRKGQRN